MLMTVAPPGPAVPQSPDTRRGALGDCAFVNGPVTLVAVAYERSYFRPAVDYWSG